MFAKTILLFSSINILTSNTASLINYQTQKVVEKNKNDNKKILDFKSIMTDAMSWKFGLNTYYDQKIIDSYDSFRFINDPKVTNIIATPIGQPNIIYEDKQFNYMGHSVLKNHSDTEQILSTPAYEKDISSTVSTSTSIGIALSASCNFEIFGSKATSSFENTNTNSTTTTKKYIIPPQNVKVPPHQQIQVNEYWSQVKMSQNVMITCDISGWARGIFHVHFPNGRKAILPETASLGQLIWAYQKFYWLDCPKELTINLDTPDIIHFTGQTECWDTGAGSSFNLDIGAPEPITN